MAVTAARPPGSDVSTPRSPGHFRADIQGLRAVAVLLVVLYHSGVPGFTGGYVGVDVFFVISGYLITAHLLGELRDSGRVSFARFYARRNSTVASRTAIEGLRVEATDGPFATGAGPLVSGTTLALTMAMAGRRAYCDDLTGPGVSIVRARCSPG